MPQMPLTAALFGLLGLASAAQAQTLALELVDGRPGAGIAINARGDMLGRVSQWPCRDRQCSPLIEPTVWTAAGGRHLLSAAPGTTAFPAALSAQGLVAGALLDFAAASQAVVWHFDGSGYQRSALGSLGLQQSGATGVDAQERVVGWARTPFVSTRPFVWSAAAGLTDLSLSGFPQDRPLGLSPGGRVLSEGYSYLLDDVASVRALPEPPAGYRTPSGLYGRINDAGDLAINLLTTSSQALQATHRWRSATGQWQALGPALPARVATGPAVIEADATILGSALGGASLAAGPDGAQQALQDQLSPAYASPEIGLRMAHGRDAKGRFLVTGVLGTASRVMRAVPIKPCQGLCLQVRQLAVSGRMVEDPRFPGQCVPRARNEVSAVLTVTDAAGLPQAGVRVQGRFLDSYDLDQRVSALTDAAGQARLRHAGPACVGTVSLLVESLQRPGARFDRGTGTLYGSVIPQP